MYIFFYKVSDVGDNIEIIQGGDTDQQLSVTTDENGQVLLQAENEGQEVYVYDDESGTYQRYVYVNQNGEPIDPSQVEGIQEGQSEVIQDQAEVVQAEDQTESTEATIVSDAAHAIEESAEDLEEDNPKSVILNQSDIGELQPGKSKIKKFGERSDILRMF